MFSTFEALVFIAGATTAAMLARHFAIRFVLRRNYSRRRQQLYILTPMFAAMFLTMNAVWMPPNAIWMSSNWPDLLIIPQVTTFQVIFMVPLLLAFSFLPNPFWKQDRQETEPR
jgi:hypothetical protein